MLHLYTNEQRWLREVTSLLPVSEIQISDEQLAALVRDGNDEAFALLVSRFSGALHRLSAQFGGAADADDLSQEGLLGLLSAAKTYRAGGAASFGTYAYTCMRNRMLSAVRAAKNEPQLVSVEEDETALPQPTGGDPAALVVRLEELETLRCHLRTVLTEREYQVLMRYLRAYSYDEIAADLSISRKSVDNALMRLRRKLAAAPFLTRR